MSLLQRQWRQQDQAIDQITFREQIQRKNVMDYYCEIYQLRQLAFIQVYRLFWVNRVRKGRLRLKKQRRPLMALNTANQLLEAARPVSPSYVNAATFRDRNVSCHFGGKVIFLKEKEKSPLFIPVLLFSWKYVEKERR